MLFSLNEYAKVALEKESFYIKPIQRLKPAQAGFKNSKHCKS
jgi:hypothetical protein